MTEKMREAVQEYLESHIDEALDLAREMNSYDGSFEWTDAWDFDELCAIAADQGGIAVGELVRAAVNGDTYGGMVRYDAYGNLEPAEENDLLCDADDYLIDIVSGLEDYIYDDGSTSPSIEISDELKEIIEEIVEEENEDDEEDYEDDEEEEE